MPRAAAVHPLLPLPQIRDLHGRQRAKPLPQPTTTSLAADNRTTVSHTHSNRRLFARPDNPSTRCIAAPPPTAPHQPPSLPPCLIADPTTVEGLPHDRPHAESPTFQPARVADYPPGLTGLHASSARAALTSAFVSATAVPRDALWRHFAHRSSRLSDYDVTDPRAVWTVTSGKCPSGVVVPSLIARQGAAHDLSPQGCQRRDPGGQPLYPGSAFAPRAPCSIPIDAQRQLRANDRRA